MQREVSIFRLYLLRATYLLVAVGLAVQMGYVRRHSVRERGDRWRDAPDADAAAGRTGVIAVAP